MGGYNSGGHNRKHITAEACVKIDAAMLRRAGVLNPAKPTGSTWIYRRAERLTCTVHVFGFPDVSEQVRILIVTPDKVRHVSDVKLSYTTCHYRTGSRRAWLHCPKCCRRVFRLFYYPNTVNHASHPVHYFACRHCYGLTYDLRRERGFDRYQSKVMKAGKKLEHWAVLYGDIEYLAALKEYDWRDLPPKPRWMRLDTYDGIATQFEDALEMSETMFYSRILGMLGDVPV